MRISDWSSDVCSSDLNALGTINGTVSALDHMRGNGGGHVVNIVSLAGLTAVPGESVYAASKHAAIGFSLSTMADLKLAGISDKIGRATCRARVCRYV